MLNIQTGPRKTPYGCTLINRIFTHKSKSIVRQYSSPNAATKKKSQQQPKYFFLFFLLCVFLIILDFFVRFILSERLRCAALMEKFRNRHTKMMHTRPHRIKRHSKKITMDYAILSRAALPTVLSHTKW